MNRALAEFVEMLSLGVCFVFGGGGGVLPRQFFDGMLLFGRRLFLRVLCFRGALARARNQSKNLRSLRGIRTSHRGVTFVRGDRENCFLSYEWSQ